jgi:copper chaperone CopZ
VCAHAVRVAVQKVDGVESVDISLQRAEADIRLRQGNRVTLEQFRRIVKTNGFAPKEARVTAVGSVRELGGRVAFDVSGTETTLSVSPDKSEPGAYRQLKDAAGASKPVFEITGTVHQRKDGSEELSVTGVKPSVAGSGDRPR